MSTYADDKLSEALKLAKGNKSRTKAQILAWIAEDHKLLLGLAKPHLQGIISLAVERAIELEKRAAKGEVPKAPKETKGERFGLDLLKAIGGPNAAKFGQEGNAPPVRRKEASDKHIDAMKLLASKSKNKPK